MREFGKLLIMFVLCTVSLQAQECIPLWEKGKMPGSKGLVLPDSIVNEIVYKVGTPGMYVFEPSRMADRKGAVLILPGGGYAHLAYQISGFHVAKWFNTIGFTAFVLNYRLPQSQDVDTCYKAPLQDAQRAMRYIRAHADEWGIKKNKIGVRGCSAGGHLSACVSTFTEDWGCGGDSLDYVSFLPDFAILVSPVIDMGIEGHKSSRTNLLGKYETTGLQALFSCDTKVTVDTPPTFLVHALNDRSVSCLNSLDYFKALQNNGVKKSSLHIFPEGGYGINLRNNPGITDFWTVLAEEWLKEIGMLE